MNKDIAKAILIFNLKGSKKKKLPLTKISEAVRMLINDEEYGSIKEVAKVFNVSGEIIRSFYRILDQPKEIQKLIEEEKILLDTSTKLLSIKNLERRIEIANVVAGMSAFDSRDIIDYCKRHPTLSVEECKSVVLESKPIEIETHAILVPLEDALFEKFKNIAKSKNMNLFEAALVAIKKWVIEEEGK